MTNAAWPEPGDGTREQQSTEIRATVRRARQLSDGSWLTVELGTTRTLFAIDLGQLEQAQHARRLAELLDDEVIDLIKRQHRRDSVQLEVMEPPIEEPYEPAPICPEHGEAFMTHSKDGRTWMSHPIEGGGWCNAKSFKV